MVNCLVQLIGVQIVRESRTIVSSRRVNWIELRAGFVVFY